jgi:hypothetical protein
MSHPDVFLWYGLTGPETAASYLREQNPANAPGSLSRIVTQIKQMQESLLDGIFWQSLPRIFQCKFHDLCRLIYSSGNLHEWPPPAPTPTPKPRNPDNQSIQGRKKKAYCGVENTRINPKWKLPENMNITQLLKPEGKKAMDIPMYNGVDICVMFHCAGKCKNGYHCNFVHDNPHDIALVAVMDSYCAKKYNSNK